MVLYPESRRALDLVAGEEAVWSDGYDVDAARERNRRAAAEEDREDVAEVVDVSPGGVPCRLYRPVDARPGVVVHLHGGGFVFHDLDVHDAAARRLANRSGLAVLSVDYRRPPEDPFPAAVEDVDAVVAHLDDLPDDLPADGPTYVHGDSAGGNLALVAALRNPGRFAAVALIYPFLDPTAGFDSYWGAEGFDPREAAWYWQQYAASPADLTHPDLAPLLSGALGTLPPTLVVTAEHDPLRDEGEHLAHRIAETGVEVVASRYLGQLHGFWRHPSVFAAVEPVLGQVAAFLRGHQP